AERIAESYAEQVEVQGAMIFLQGLDLTAAMSMKIYRAFGAASPELIREDPYRLCEELSGFGFKRADQIALQLGFEADSPLRLAAGVRHVLDLAAQEGHCCLPQSLLHSQAAAVLGAQEDQVAEAVQTLLLSGKLVRKKWEDQPEAWIYPRGYFLAEGKVAHALKEIADSPVEPLDQLDNQLERVQQRLGVRLDDSQLEAVRMAMTHGVCVMTGGPGTGKTTTIGCMIALLEGAGLTVKLAAPTGRAAKRMTEATGRPAMTLHRLLEYGAPEDAEEGEELAFQRNEQRPLKADALIVDETSMVDLMLMSALVAALPRGIRLILVGDVDQLPSVGPGNVLRDVIGSRMVPVAYLRTIFRQGENSLIVGNAHRILAGEMPVLNRRDSDFFLNRAVGQQQTQQTILDLVSRRLPAYMGLDPRQIQVLSPMKKGPCGVWELNRLLQERLNPAEPGKPQWSGGGGPLRQGDRVMQTRNNYTLAWTRVSADGSREEDKGVFNGDMGVLRGIDLEQRLLFVRFDDDREAVYDFTAADELELCYCVSVHKSQGSEFPAVVMPCVGGPPMLLNRNLFYTAVTRARRLVVLAGQENCIARMVENVDTRKRYSGLCACMRLFMEGQG
ncbi:MAG: AAA family ATPase, partial [Christensenellales bacterium]